MNEALSQWNRLAKRQDQLYHRCARQAGLPVAQFWVLYALCESREPLSQNTFCESWCYSKQTVNTAVAGLERAGLIRLTFAQGSRKQKDLRLTEAGQVFCDRHIRTVQAREERALDALPDHARDQFFETLNTLLAHLEQELI